MLAKAIRMTVLGQLARRARWSLAPAPRTGWAGRVSVPRSHSVMETGVPVEWVVRVENHSRNVWHRGAPAGVGLRYQWHARTGRAFGEAHDTPLPRTLLPGDWADIPVAVSGPAAVGDFTLAWELVAAGNPAGIGTRPEPLPVHVTFPHATDIDYHHVYRTADLGANSWWVVGAYPTQDDYLQSSRKRREMLVDEGLTPDSRVLDVGCGTGQMAMALEDYLSPRGAYYGTDIGREAIDYCRAHYRRPNFAFEVGEMTRIPFPTSAGPFDLAIYFSVFTHTFVDESVLLLAETARLLGPKGAIVADIIVSDLVARGAGHRGQMWVNRDHFFRLAAALGFETTVMGTFPWGAHAERLMLRLARRA